MEGLQQFSPSASTNNEIDAGDIFEETTRDKDFLIEEGDSEDIFSTCASAQENLDMEKQQSEASYGSSPRGVLDISTGSSCSESSSSIASISDPETPAASPTASFDLRGLLSFWKPKSMRRLSVLPSIRNLKLSIRESLRSGASSPAFLADLDFCCLKPSWKNFTIEELRLATNNFSAENVLGKGGYGDVYKGRLPNGQLVAIKRMTRGTAEERTGDFLCEIGIMVHINHRNAAKLIGFGVEGGMHIVLKLSPNGSLASLLHELNWSIRYKVAVGTAEGLHYLHERCQRRIIHRDIKAANILLTEDFEPQICDFGLAKWLPAHWTHHTVSNFEGTFGYLAPEYSMHGIVDEKTDVFAFGVLLLELISGRQAVDSLQKSLVMWAMPLLEKNNIRELVDPALASSYDSQQMSRVALAASLCIQHSSILRPRMSQIVQLLKGQSSLESTKPSPQSVLQRTNSDVEDCNSSRYLNDLNRHRQLALDY